MANFHFIVRDSRHGICEGTLIALDRAEAESALQEHDVLEIWQTDAGDWLAGASAVFARVFRGLRGALSPSGDLPRPASRKGFLTTRPSPPALHS